MAGLNLFTNNAATTLASGITNVATSLTVATGDGAEFPTLAGSQYFYCTLANNAGAVEIIKVTARSSDTFTIVRAQDGTSAAAWSSGDKVELRLTRIDLLNFPQLDSTNTFAAAQTFSATPVFSAGITSTAVPVTIASGGTNNGALATTAGGVLYTDGTKVVNVGAGTTGQALTSNGAGAPTWGSAGRSGISYVTLTTGTTNVTLTSSSNQLQVISADQAGCSVTLPDMTTLTKGSGYFVFYNTSPFPIAIKDTGGTIREYLLTSNNIANTQQVNGSPLNIEDNATANGVWHIQNNIVAGINTTFQMVETTGAANSYFYKAYCILNTTQFILILGSASGSGTQTIYAQLVTINTSTKALTFATPVAAGTVNSLSTLREINIDSNGSDRALLSVSTSQFASSTETTGTFHTGIGIVANVLYVSTSQYGPQYNNGQGSRGYGVTWSRSGNWFISIVQGATSATLTDSSLYIYAFQVNISGTTVTLVAATGNGASLASQGNNNNAYSVAPTGYTSFVADGSTGTRGYLNFNTGTTTVSTGTRTSQTSQIAGLVTPSFGVGSTGLGQGRNPVLVNSALSKVMYNPSTSNNNPIGTYAVTNPGAATVTVASTTVNYKPFASKNYLSTSLAPINITSAYAASSSSVWVYTSATNTIYNADPTNANFNINYANFIDADTVTGSVTFYMFNSATSLMIVQPNYGSNYKGRVGIISLPTPFVS